MALKCVGSGDGRVHDPMRRGFRLPRAPFQRPAESAADSSGFTFSVWNTTQ
jgi:hypothetical protein